MILGKLVPFEGRKKDREAGRSRDSRGAEILIFTGVRYERDTSSTAPTKPTASSGGKRKRV